MEEQESPKEEVPPKEETPSTEPGPIKQWVLMNPQGEICCGIRFNYFDSPHHEQELCKLEGYKVWLSDNKNPDCWAIQCTETEPWIAITHGMMIEKLEVVCEL